MDLMRRLAAIAPCTALLAASILSLAGCGGAEEARSEGLAPPDSYNMVSSPRSLDVGINGEGFFVLQSPNGAERSYSRLGRLDLNAEGRLIHSDGSWVLGRSNRPGLDAEPLDRAPLEMRAQRTTRLQLEGNLDASDSEVMTPFDARDGSTYNFSTSIEIHTPSPRILAVFFSKVSVAGSWAWTVHFSIDDRVTVARLPLRFGPDGRLAPGAPTWVHIPAGDADLPQGIDVQLGAFTQYGARYSLSSMRQDGFAGGVLAHGQLEPDGRLTLHYSNGQYRSGGQLLLARFTVADRLLRSAQSSWHCGQDCAPPMLGTPGSALLGTLMSGALNDGT